jgi:hypothetical protein
MKSTIPTDQRTNAIHALKSIITNLKVSAWSQEQHTVLKTYVQKMDQVKHVTVRDHCEFLAHVLDFFE